MPTVRLFTIALLVHCFYYTIGLQTPYVIDVRNMLLKIKAYFCVGYEMLEQSTGFINAQNVYINHETT